MAPADRRHDVEGVLAEGRVARLGAAEWQAVADGFPEVARHATGIAGDLLIVRTGLGLAAVEAPHDGERVVRLLGDQAQADRFVADRLAQYERMWEGCGCRVEYYV